MQSKTTLFVSFISFRSIAAASETPGIPYTPGVYALRPAPSLSFLSLPPPLLSVQKCTGTKDESAHIRSFVRSFVLYPGLYSAFPSLPLPSRSVSLSRACFFFSFFTEPEHGARSVRFERTSALVGKIEATARHAPASPGLPGVATASPSPPPSRRPPSVRPNERLATSPTSPDVSADRR